MRAPILLLATLALLSLPPAALAAQDDVDHRVLVRGASAPEAGDAPLRLVAFEPGERYEWEVEVAQEYATFEMRLEGAFDVERPRQVVPTLEVEGIAYPLFYPFPNERVWEVDGPARVFHVHEEEGAIVLRLGVPGPANGTLALTRDVTPPAFELGEVTNLTHFSFYRETRTQELAYADLQVREKGTEEWVRNPTPAYHVLQRFPVQGLDPDTEYEVRVVFEDWAGNVATSEVHELRTPPIPPRPKPVVTPLAPAPNESVVAGGVVVRARVESPEAPVTSVRLFFDLKEVEEGFSFENGTLTFYPRDLLTDGLHTVSVEATNAEGGMSFARWSFQVGEERRESPAAPALAAPLAVAALLLARRRL